MWIFHASTLPKPCYSDNIVSGDAGQDTEVRCDLERQTSRTASINMAATTLSVTPSGPWLSRSLTDRIALPLYASKVS